MSKLGTKIPFDLWKMTVKRWDDRARGEPSEHRCGYCKHFNTSVMMEKKDGSLDLDYDCKKCSLFLRKICSNDNPVGEKPPEEWPVYWHWRHTNDLAEKKKFAFRIRFEVMCDGKRWRYVK